VSREKASGRVCSLNLNPKARVLRILRLKRIHIDTRTSRIEVIGAILEGILFSTKVLGPCGWKNLYGKFLDPSNIGLR